MENYSANITCTYIPSRVLVCTSLGGADDLELPSFPFLFDQRRNRSLPFFSFPRNRASLGKSSSRGSPRTLEFEVFFLFFNRCNLGVFLVV